MKLLATFLNRIVAGVGLIAGCIACAQAAPPVSVKVYAQHIGSKVVYHYRVSNNGSAPISSVWIGYDDQNDRDDNNDVWELNELPAGWNPDTGIPPDSATSPPDWRVYVITPEATETHAVAWAVADDNSSRIASGNTVKGLSIVLDKADASYQRGHAAVKFAGQYRVTVPLDPLDLSPPSLSVTLSPPTLWPPNGKLNSIGAQIAVTDNYDPQPQIKLESIVANESLEKDDIRDAHYGTDDRSFKLKAEREGKNQAGRIYTVTYSATDASGNKATASATVTVPHDRRQGD